MTVRHPPQRSLRCFDFSDQFRWASGSGLIAKFLILIPECFRLGGSTLTGRHLVPTLGAGIKVQILIRTRVIGMLLATTTARTSSHEVYRFIFDDFCLHSMHCCTTASRLVASWVAVCKERSVLESNFV